MVLEDVADHGRPGVGHAAGPQALDQSGQPFPERWDTGVDGLGERLVRGLRPSRVGFVLAPQEVGVAEP